MPEPRNDMPERTKRARGNYAKLICLRCRDRRVKCKLPTDVSIQASTQPQPPATSCERCRNKGLECIVRKTTLGRPNRKWPDALTTPPASIVPDGERSASPSPCIDELVLCNPEDVAPEETRNRSPEIFREPTVAIDAASTGMSLAYAMDHTVDRTLALLGQDDHFGRALADLERKMPPSILDVVDEEFVSRLDPHLVWVRLNLPHIPSLMTLYRAIQRSDLDGGAITSAIALLAILCSVALDAPVELPPQMLQAQDTLRVITYHNGRNLLFTLRPHAYTLMFLEVIHSYRPLSLMSGREPAAHALTGKLYTTLGKMVALQLGLQNSTLRLREFLDGRTPGDARQLVYDALQWSWWLVSDPRVHGELKATNPAVPEPELVLEQTMAAVSDAFDRGVAPVEALMAFHTLRHEADDLYAMRCMTKDWNNLEALKLHVGTRDDAVARRQRHFEKCLRDMSNSQSQLIDASALAQLSTMQVNNGRTDTMGLAMFYAIMSVTSTSAGNAGRNFPVPTGPFSRYFVECLAQHSPHNDGSPVGSFLDQFGDLHVDGLEKRLAAFISVASELKLMGTPFMAPPRKLCCNIVYCCKGIVENSAVRLRLSADLHHRNDVHLILFMEAARCLENMEANGGTPEAMARGSLPTACAKIVRSLHRIVLQWKRNHVGKESKVQAPSTNGVATTSVVAPGPTQDMTSLDWDALLNDDLFADWENWAAADNLLGQELELNLPLP